MQRQSIDHYITYSVISAKPELSYTSVVSTIRAYPVTSGKHEGQTFITWTGNFSSDADASAYNHTPRNDKANISRCHPGCQVQAPRGSGGPRQGRFEEIDSQALRDQEVE